MSSVLQSSFINEVIEVDEVTDFTTTVFASDVSVQAVKVALSDRIEMSILNFMVIISLLVNRYEASIMQVFILDVIIRPIISLVDTKRLKLVLGLAHQGQ